MQASRVDLITNLTMWISYRLLISGALLLSVAVLCHGDPVLDTDGNEVKLGAQYVIKNSAKGSRGGLGALYKRGCLNYIYENPERGLPVEIYLPESKAESAVPGSKSESVVQLGSRYKFSFFMSAARICDTSWSIGDPETKGGISFKPITAGQIFSAENLSWFEVRSTDETGVYELAACSCQFCRIACPEVGTFVVNGTKVLGVRGSPYAVRFQNYVPRAMETAAQ